MKLYIIRHGTTKWNVERRLQGRKDSELTEEGIKRAIMLRDRLQDVDFDMIYSSPLNRALETAKIIKGQRNIEIIIHKSLCELDFGNWEGMQISEIERKFPKEYYSYIKDPESYIPIDGESFEELFNRVQHFLDDIEKLDAKNILVVTHGVTIKAIIAIIKRLSLKEFSSIPVYTGTALNICDISKNKIEILVEGDITHIS